jgi:hypothetical protein
MEIHHKRQNGKGKNGKAKRQKEEGKGQNGKQNGRMVTADSRGVLRMKRQLLKANFSSANSLPVPCSGI